jgi:hypothetical protein
MVELSLSTRIRSPGIKVGVIEEEGMEYDWTA